MTGPKLPGMQHAPPSRFSEWQPLREQQLVPASPCRAPLESALSSVREIDLDRLTKRAFRPSPQHWEDELMYFMMVDRFSDNRENDFCDNDGNRVTSGRTPRFTSAAKGNAIRTRADSNRWNDAGKRFVGGTLAGATSKIGYLERLGITALWISPVFKQANYNDKFEHTYHGYAIQNFLDVDPRFGTREELCKLVDTAHGRGMSVILDIVINHAGDVFRYRNGFPKWNGEEFAVRGFRDVVTGEPTLPFKEIDLWTYPGAFPDAGVWPKEFQDRTAFTRKGQIVNMDNFPEAVDGDFQALKDFHHGRRVFVDGKFDRYEVSPTLRNLCEVYKYWIALADIDGFRLDSVKHIDPGAVRFFTEEIHEFARSIGKKNFYLIGEIAGRTREETIDLVDQTGLDAALGVSNERAPMTGLVKGKNDPEDYFNLFANSVRSGRDLHVWFRDKVVTSVDDHDNAYQGMDWKHRFAAGGFEDLVVAAAALNATTLGIPCLYYGTEQNFDGEGGTDDYIREAMFGGDFGAFRSRGYHFFDEKTLTYCELAKINKLRRRWPALSRGRQYLRPISGNGVDFGLPRRRENDLRSIVAWSRILDDQEVLCAINTNPDNPTTAYVKISDDLHVTSGRRHLTCLYSTDSTQEKKDVRIREMQGTVVLLTVPPAGFVIYA